MDSVEHPAPVMTSSQPMESEPIASKRPWPYGWSESGGSEPMRSAIRVSASEIKSERLCAASHIMAELWPRYPARPLPTESTRLTAAPTQVICEPSELSAAALRLELKRGVIAWRLAATRKS